MHGGGLVAILDAATRALGTRDAPRVIEGRLTASVPIATALVLDGSARAEGGARHRPPGGPDAHLGLGARLRPAPEPAPRGRRGGAARLGSSADVGGLSRVRARNPLGLQRRSASTRTACGRAWRRARPGWPEPGRAHAALAPVLLDEVAWWLGALIMREGGLTNRIQVTLDAAALPAAGPLLAAGRFADVEPVDRKRTFWRTAARCFDAEGGRARDGEHRLSRRDGVVGPTGALLQGRGPTARSFARMFPSYV